MKADLGRLDERIYNREDDKPIEPKAWGQKNITIHETTMDGDEISFVVEATWESLRQALMKYGPRHSLLIALMPTATSAQILGNLESTEGPQSLFYSRKLMTGNFTVTVPHLIEDLDELGLYTPEVINFVIGMGSTLKLLDRYVADHPKEFPRFFISSSPVNYTEEKEDPDSPILARCTSDSSEASLVVCTEMMARLRFLQRKYLTMFEISQKDVIRQAAQRGRYVCQSQSLNIYVPEPTVEKLSGLHSYTNRIGLKTGMYYLRQKPSVQVAQFGGSNRMMKYIATITGDKGRAKELAIAIMEAPPTIEEEEGGGCTSCTA
jgi:ribonucleotide reductase alpha subunit